MERRTFTCRDLVEFDGDDDGKVTHPQVGTVTATPSNVTIPGSSYPSSSSSLLQDGLFHCKDTSLIYRWPTTSEYSRRNIIVKANDNSRPHTSTDNVLDIDDDDDDVPPSPLLRLLISSSSSSRPGLTTNRCEPMMLTPSVHSPSETTSSCPWSSGRIDHHQNNKDNDVPQPLCIVYDSTILSSRKQKINHRMISMKTTITTTTSNSTNTSFAIHGHHRPSLSRSLALEIPGRRRRSWNRRTRAPRRMVRRKSVLWRPLSWLQLLMSTSMMMLLMLSPGWVLPPRWGGHGPTYGGACTVVSAWTLTSTGFSRRGAFPTRPFTTTKASLLAMNLAIKTKMGPWPSWSSSSSTLRRGVLQASFAGLEGHGQGWASAPDETDLRHQPYDGADEYHRIDSGLDKATATSWVTGRATSLSLHHALPKRRQSSVVMHMIHGVGGYHRRIVHSGGWALFSSNNNPETPKVRSNSPGNQSTPSPRPPAKASGPKDGASTGRVASNSNSSRKQLDQGASAGVVNGDSVGPDDEEREEEEFRALYKSLQLYKAAFGEVSEIPADFVVPALAPWPPAAWTWPLGQRVQQITQSGRYLKTAPPARRQKRLAALQKVGLTFKPPAKKQPPPQQVLSAPPDAASMPTIKNDVSASPAVPLSGSTASTGAVRQPAAAEWNLESEKPSSMPPAPPVPATPVAVRPATVFPSAPSMTNVAEQRYSDNSAVDDDDADSREQAYDARFQKVLEALETYKQIYGDLLVPQPFEVPDGAPAWPQSTWGLRLGARVNAIRSQGTFLNNYPERRQILEDMGFVWNPPRSKRRAGRRADEDDGPDERPTAPSPRSSESESRLRVESTPSPKSATDAGLRQQGIAGGSRGGKENDDFMFDESDDADNDENDIIAENGSFGFDRDTVGMEGEVGDRVLSPTWNLEKARLPEKVVKAMEEAATPDDDYAEPPTLEDSLKEASARALEAGIILGRTENNRVIKGKQEKDIPWFNDDFGDDFVFDDVVEALTVYKSMYGDFSNLTMSDEFVIPFPKEESGFLGSDDDDDDQMGLLDTFDVDASARATAAIAGFEAEGRWDRSQDLIAAEIKRLQEEVSQASTATTTKSKAMDVRLSTLEWPEHLGGMMLGRIAARIRDGSLEVKHLTERKAQLDAIGFDWGDPRYFIDVPFEKAMCSLFAYYMIRGDTFVDESFVMPNEDPWPEALAGHELGAAVKRLRELQNFLEAYYPEKVSLLRMLDFVWFSDTVALPLDPNEPELTPEMLLLCAMGHPDYAKMIDIPMGLPDKIVNDGPFFKSDDPKQWWRVWHNWDYVKDYWYQQGRRDNAYVLRAMGYTQMADEHEAKYGPGLFSMINETLTDLDMRGPGGRPEEEKKILLESLNYYRQELLGCTDIHPQTRDALMAEFDRYMLAIMNDGKMDLAFTDESAVASNPRKNLFERPLDEMEFTLLEEEAKPASRDEEEGYDDLEDGDDDFDYEEELGLGNR